MINGKSVIAIIPARGGSKGLPGKNIRDLCGKPLIAWSIEAGLHSQYIDEVMVTTDSEAIAAIGKQYGASVPFLRPAELASDGATSYSAVEHTLNFYTTQQRRNFDFVALLEPTSPLRAKTDIDEMLEKLASLSEQYDAIVSLGQVHEHPEIVKKLSGNDIKPYCPELEPHSRRQDREPAYFPYGVAYIVKVTTLLEEKTFYPRRTTHKVVPRNQCYEIDDLYDFLSVENIMNREFLNK
jgi:CMP-N,N'-diacetyllegionaminic acid synthase